ncbi:unnamed protein product [Musa hybrid cultivar]
MCLRTRSMSPSPLIHGICTYHKFSVCCKIPTRLRWQRECDGLYTRPIKSHLYSLFFSNI